MYQILAETALDGAREIFQGMLQNVLTVLGEKHGQRIIGIYCIRMALKLETSRKSIIARFRCSNHNLAIERQRGILSRENRIRKFCKSRKIADEIHFLLEWYMISPYSMLILLSSKIFIQIKTHLH